MENINVLEELLMLDRFFLEVFYFYLDLDQEHLWDEY